MGLNERLRNIARTREKSALSKSPRVHISPDFLHIQAGLHPEVDGENNVWGPHPHADIGDRRGGPRGMKPLCRIKLVLKRKRRLKDGGDDTVAA